VTLDLAAGPSIGSTSTCAVPTSATSTVRRQPPERQTATIWPLASLGMLPEVIGRLSRR
jgi:hypothetical protein